MMQKVLLGIFALVGAETGPLGFGERTSRRTCVVTQEDGCMKCAEVMAAFDEGVGKFQAVDGCESDADWYFPSSST